MTISDYKKYVRPFLIFSSIILIFILHYPYLLGLILGCIITSLVFLFPSDIELIILNILFKFDDKILRKTQNESEKFKSNKIKYRK